MAFNEELAERLRRILAGRAGVEEKRMFGGVAFLLRGNMCCGVAKDDLVLRLGPEGARTALAEPQVRVFDLTGRAMKGWVTVGPAGWEDEDDLRRRVELAAAFAGSLPPK